MTVVLSGADVRRCVTRIAHELLETGVSRDELLVLGIPTRGVPLARRISAEMDRLASAAAVSGGRAGPPDPVPVGSLDITMYRDDLDRAPTRMPSPTEVPVPVTGRVVVLVDDVLFSGRTVRAALDALRDLGRPAMVRLAVLVDRGHRRLPIRPDHVGRNLPTSLTQRVHVQVAEIDGADAVEVAEVDGAEATPAPAAGATGVGHG